MKTVMNVAEAKAKLSELLERAERGEEVLIARKGVAAVKLVSIKNAEKPKPDRATFFGALEGLAALTDDALMPEPTDAWYSEQGIPEFDVPAVKVAAPNVAFDRDQ